MIMYILIFLALVLVQKSTSYSNFIGLGYTIVDGNPDAIAHRGVDNGINFRRIVNITELGGYYITSDRKTSCQTKNSTFIFYSPKTYQDYLKNSIKKPGDNSVLPDYLSWALVDVIGHWYDPVSPFAFTKSAEFHDIQNRTTVNHEVFFDTIGVCNLGQTRYRLPRSVFDVHYVTDEFAADVCSLPVLYDKKSYQALLKKWGTHVIVAVETGIKTVTRYSQSAVKLAQFFQQYDLNHVRVSSQSYQRYNSVVRLNTQNFNSIDVIKNTGGHLESTITLGTMTNPHPVVYELLPIDRFVRSQFFTTLNGSKFIQNGQCSFDMPWNIDKLHMNVLTALADYTRINDLYQPPKDYELLVPITWPRGTYGLYRPDSGCPKSPIGFSFGWRQIAEDANNQSHWTSNIHMSSLTDQNKTVFNFCMKTTNENSEYEHDWPKGNYCILKKYSCPTGFSSGSIFWDNEDSADDNGHDGVLPDGFYGNHTRINFCCRNDGSANTSILLPIDTPFYLLRYTSDCQKVYGMIVTDEHFEVATEDFAKNESCSGAHPYDPHCGGNHDLRLCYYEKDTIGEKFIGMGYNLLAGNPDGGEYLHTDSDAGLKTARYIFSINASAQLDVLENDVKDNCIPETTKTVFNNAQSYQKYLLSKTETFGPADDGIRPYAFTASQRFKRIENATIHGSSFVLYVETVCGTGRTRYKLLPGYLSLRPNKEFIRDMGLLPLVYDKDSYLQFLDKWGTHVVVEVETGIKNTTQFELTFDQASGDIFSGAAKGGNLYITYKQDGTFIHVNGSSLSSHDFKDFYGNNSFRHFSNTVGFQGNSQTISYKLATIAYFMDMKFFRDLFSPSFNYYLVIWQNNTEKAIADYALNKGQNKALNVEVPVYWPRGTYGFFKPINGCPSSAGFEGNGYRLFDTEDHNNANKWSSDIQLTLKVDLGSDPIFYFCVKIRNIKSRYSRDWPAGNYCILKKGDCPSGFTPGSLTWDGENSRNANRNGGTMPDGRYDSDTIIEFCCRNDGNVKTPILLPIHEPFYLLRYHERDCQEVAGMNVKKDFFHFDDEDSDNSNACSGAYPYDDEDCKRDHTLNFCYYTPKVKQGVGTIFG